MNIFRIISLIVVLVLMGACAAPISSDVTRFNTLAPPRGETFIVVSKDKALEGSLEMAAYAAEVSAHMRAQGYVAAGEGTPDLVVSIGYGISDPFEVENNRRPPPYFGPTYFGQRHPFYSRYRARYYNPWFDPWYGYSYGLGSFYRYRYAYLYDTADYRRVVYERVFEMAIQKNGGAYVFEGRAVSIGASNSLPAVLPLMIDALFTDFPGENGSTVRVKVDAGK